VHEWIARNVAAREWFTWDDAAASEGAGKLSRVFHHLIYAVTSSRCPTQGVRADVFANVMHPAVGKGEGFVLYHLDEPACMVVMTVCAKDGPKGCLPSAAQEINHDIGVRAGSSIDQDAMGV
jgi:hypothetical protein